MRSSSLTNLRGLVSNGAQLKVETVKAINHAAMYAKRGPGYSPASDALTTMLTAAIAALKTYTRSASIALNVSSGTLAAGDVVPLTVTATWADASTQVVTRPASGTVTLSSNPANNDTVTLGSLFGSARVYTFKTALSGAANEVLIGANVTATAANLKAAVNGQTGAGSTYGTGTVAHDTLSASSAAGVATVFTTDYHQGGNTVTLAKSGANIAVSGALLTGGLFDGRVTFATSDATKAVVNIGGRISRVAAGSATITASFQGRTATYAATLS